MLSEILNNNSISDFHNKLSSEMSASNNAYSYLGVNFKGSEILSYKLYYTFFDLQSVKYFFPVPKLKERFLSYENKFSNHISTPRVPGCGITFTTKFDTKTQQISQGVYFRIIEPTERYINKFLNSIKMQSSEHQHKFDRDSHLKYLSIDSNSVIQERNYIYCNQPDFLNLFDQKPGMSFSKLDCLEISTDWEDELQFNNIRFIGLGALSLTEHVQNEIKRIKQKLNSSFIHNTPLMEFYGYYIFKDEKSIFFFGENDNNLISSLKNSNI